MPEAPRPPDEQARLRALRAYEILDTPPEPSFDRLSRLAAMVLGTPMALITLVDAERQWFKARIGLDLQQTDRALSFCAYAVADRELVVVPDATDDRRFRDNPMVLGPPSIRFYAGAPLTTPDGFVLGTLCGIDTVPHVGGLSEAQQVHLTDLASLVVDELELRRSVRLLEEQRYALEMAGLATDAASDAILITEATPLDGPDGPRIVYANQAFLTMSGFDREEVLGRTPRIVQGPDTDPETLGRIGASLRAGRACHEEILNYRKDGSAYWVDLHISPVAGDDARAPLFVSVQRDITQRQAEQQALVEREARYRLLFEQNPQCLWVFDADTGRLLDVNDAALSLSGCSRQEFLAKTIYDLFAEEDRGDVRRRLVDDPTPGTPSEWRQLRHDGTTVDVRVQTFGTTPQARRARLALVTDVTVERQLEEQLRQSQKMEAVGALAGGVAHDFNNLLTVINGYTDLILQRLGPDAPVRGDLVQVQRAGDRASALTQQLLAFSRRQVLQPQVVQVPAVVRGLQPMMTRVLRENIELTVVAPDGVPPVVVDPNQLELVLLNLALNASDAMAQGGELTITCSEVVGRGVTAAEDVPAGHYAVITVSDSGVGMDEAVFGRIFEPFFTTKPKGRGTGLGLPTAYGIVRQTGGYLTAESEPGAGSTFRVYLPVAPAGSATMTTDDRTATRDLRGSECILVVEDDEAVRRFATELLTEYGYTVLAAVDGAEALRLAAERHGRIDLLLTDVVMPRMGGRQVAEVLRQRHDVTRVLFMSGYTEDTIVRQGVLEPGLQFLAKPFTPQGLLEKVRGALDTPDPVRTVVVADDEAPLRRLLAMTLARAGYQVFEASHGREAIELCRQQRVDLLLTDLVMPEQEGLETIRELRAELPHVHIVAMSGAFDGKFLDVARAFGAGAVLQKPFDGRTVLETVASLIGPPEQAGTDKA